MTRPLTFQQIEAFRAVILSGTTVAAARMLHTTQPTVSRLLNQAQSATGLQLFINDRGRLKLTREGQYLFETIQVSYQGLARVEQAVGALRESGAGVFRIACTPSLAQSVLPVAMERFAKKYNQVRFNVETIGSRQIEEGLRLGLYDIALTNKAYEGSEFDITEVHQTKAVCVAAHDHSFVKLDVVTVADLQGQILISLPYEDELEVALREAFASEGIKSRTSIETIYSSTICSFAARGLGVGVINPYMASVFSDRLCIRTFAPALPITTYVAFAKFSPVSELAQHFITALKASFPISK